ncbi:MAG: universal stress protein A [Thiomicrorhabdus sp.]|nr:MAG: universal stress protein A [Thiomicrorhabdus sp.]
MSSYQKILVAIDFSEHSLKALEKAQSMAEMFKADITLIHIAEVPIYPLLEDVAVTGMPGLWDDEFLQRMVKASDQRLEKLRHLHAISHAMTIVGDPSSEIVTIASSNHIDLIVMGFHGASGFSRLIGSTTHSVINDAPCDVLAVKLDDTE